MYSHLFLLFAGLKLLLIPFYYSTDFEVHRNWLAITNSLPYKDWYYESISEWTLDYPPLFAWFEYGLSFIAKLFDPEMVVLKNLNYASNNTILFQRLSVIVTDVVYAVGVKRCSDLIQPSPERLKTFLLMFANPALMMVDHIHFQYNGFLFGFLLLSIGDILQGRYLMSAFWFSILLNLKHIYLYMAPAYFVYLLRVYCFTVSSSNGTGTAWYSFSLKRLIKLGFVVLSVFVISFGPFWKHLPQVLSRLFPFKRGLTHAYWAPNFWALYNFIDKVLIVFFCKLGANIGFREASMTGGLVQEYSHSVLPSISPAVTFILTALTMTPALVKLWYLCADKENRSLHFIRCLIICATCSFMFGWHVHEKAILLTLIPLSFLSVMDASDGEMYVFISSIGSFSLFPLLFHKSLLNVKFFLSFAYCACISTYIPNLYPIRKSAKRKDRPFLKMYESLAIFSIVPIWLYTDVFHFYLGHDKMLPFLPLMITSVYCAVQVTYFWWRYYRSFLNKTVIFEHSQTKVNKMHSN